MPRTNVLPVEKGHEASQTEPGPKMSRTKVPSAGKGHVAYQNESEPPTLIELFRTLNHKFEKLDRLLVRRGNNLNGMMKEVRNINQRRAGRQQLQTQQPCLAVKADALEGKKTHESREDFAPNGRLGDISYDRVYDPMRLTSFGEQEHIELPALPCRDDAPVNQGHEVAKPCLSPVEMRKSTPGGGLLHAGSASTNKVQGTNFLSQLLPWSFRETSEEKNIGTIRQTFATCNRSWHPKGNETKSRQNLVFDPGG